MIQSIICKILGHYYTTYIFVKDDKSIRTGLACKRCNKDAVVLKGKGFEIHDGLWYFVDIKNIMIEGNDSKVRDWKGIEY